MASVGEQVTVERVDTALRLYRRMLGRAGLIVLVGLVAALVVGRLLGQGAATTLLIATLVALVAEIWIDGRAMGRALDDRVLLTMPLVGFISAPTILAQRAVALGMEWGPRFGPLRPARKR
jgi:hypothetical protein